MFFKKFICCLLVILSFVNVCNVTAARTGEFETEYVEFKAIVPDNFNAVVAIELTDKKTGLILEYCLYEINDYLSNVGVPVGSYSVSVSIPDHETDEFNFIYDKKFSVKKSAVALPFLVIVDDASLNEAGIVDEEQGSTSSQEDVENVLFEVFEEEQESESVTITENDSSVVSSHEEEVVSESSNEEESRNNSGTSSIVSSLIVSFLLIVVGAVIYFYVKRRNES